MTERGTGETPEYLRQIAGYTERRRIGDHKLEDLMLNAELERLQGASPEEVHEALGVHAEKGLTTLVIGLLLQPFPLSSHTKEMILAQSFEAKAGQLENKAIAYGASGMQGNASAATRYAQEAAEYRGIAVRIRSGQ